MVTHSWSWICTASSMGVSSRLAVMRLEPMPSVIELPSSFSSPLLTQL